uniref:EF-hand domain-containing protein n=1 Tax=Kalanchoe fedtschenkoi TaxID=63787 RepID=A0A7N0UC95_KALFE
MSFLNFRIRASNKPSEARPAVVRSIPIEPHKKTAPPAPTTLKKPGMDDLRRVFDKFDADRDGKISRNEYKAAVRAMGKGGAGANDAETAKAFAAMDSDGDGFICFKEFVGVYEADGGLKTGEIESAFRAYDLDGDGKVSAEELAQVLRRVGECCSLEACRKMVRAVDADGDGYVSLDEFLSMMTRSMKASP